MKRMVPAGAIDLFKKTFGRDPEVVASAPGRVNLIGEHLDYNGGQVLPMAIEMRTTVALARTDQPLSRSVSTTENTAGAFDIRNPSRSGSWWDYIAGVAREMPVDLPQVEIAVSSDVPSGAGLSSSAALEVACAMAMSRISGHPTETEELARIGWRAENKFVGVDSGIMDQFASALGRDANALHLWCDTEASEYVPFTNHVLVFDTGVKRSLRNSAFNTRRDECERALELLKKDFPSLKTLAAATEEQVRAADLPEPIRRRAIHVTTENQRVEQAVAALKQTGNFPGTLLYASHASLRDLYECSSPELDWFVEHASQEQGIDGARLTGAGWGGCAIAVGSRDALENAAAKLFHDYEREFKLTPRTWITSAARGVE
ncbi:MAG TPA: galactokinase [Gemmatimonadaceae bacterium]|nr:galactokinase [Gemmatimonadaceae bacterium]